MQLLPCQQASSLMVLAASADNTRLWRLGTGAVSRAQTWCHSWLLAAPARVGDSQQGRHGIQVWPSTVRTTET